MKSSEVIEVFNSSIATTKAKGIEHVPIENLEAFAKELNDLVEKTPDDVAAGEASLEEYRAHLSAWVSSSQQAHEMRLEMLRAVITVGQSALKSALLINGGASVAMLAFIGRIWGSTGAQPTVDALTVSLLSYVFGVLSSAMAAGATYFSQAGYAGEFGGISGKVGRAGHVAAVIFVFGGYYLFARGSFFAFNAIGLN